MKKKKKPTQLLDVINFILKNEREVPSRVVASLPNGPQLIT